MKTQQVAPMHIWLSAGCIGAYALLHGFVHFILVAKPVAVPIVLFFLFLFGLTMAIIKRHGWVRYVILILAAVITWRYTRLWLPFIAQGSLDAETLLRLSLDLGRAACLSLGAMLLFSKQSRAWFM